MKTLSLECDYYGVDIRFDTFCSRRICSFYLIRFSEMWQRLQRCERRFRLLISEYSAFWYFFSYVIVSFYVFFLYYYFGVRPPVSIDS